MRHPHTTEVRHVASAALALLVATACSTAAPSSAPPPAAASEAAPSAPQLGKSSIQDVIRALTREEKASLVMGTGMADPNLPADLQAPTVGHTEGPVPGAAGVTFAIPRLGIPAIVLADGPAGLRIKPTRAATPGQTYHCTAFPIASALASTWNPGLVEDVGKALGAEVRDYGVDVLLAPALNVHRSALGGRNFEYYSEDPLLSGSMAAAMVRGVQSNGVGTSIKHFAANDHEWNRNVIDVRVDERALREIYLRGFEIAVKDGRPWTVMSSYNKINGTYTSEDPRLLTEILRGEWGFDGLVMTDWFGGRDPAAQMVAGNDLLMPGTERQRKALLDALTAGSLDETVLDRNIERLLQLILQTRTFQGPPPAGPVDLRAGARVARAAAAEGVVLLKNERGRLPLARAGQLALFGNGSYEVISGGTGSGDVHEAHTVSLSEGLTAAGYAADGELDARYRSYLASENEKQPPRTGIDAFLPVALVPEPQLEGTLLQGSAKRAAAAIITLRRSSGEFVDRSPDDFELAAAEKTLVRDVSRVFRAAGKPVIVILNVGGAVEVASWRQQVDAIVLAWQPGQEAGHALADVISGAVNPSGKLPVTFPLDWKDAPSAKGFPGVVLEAGEGKPSPGSGAKAARVEYDDGLAVGYRHFGTRAAAVAFSFGHGLSYTTFEYGALQVQPASAPGHWVATLSVKNTGKVAGAEAVQLYASANEAQTPKGGLATPSLELRRFAKTRPLQPGEAEALSFDLGPRELASFDPHASAWVARAGKYTLRAGASSTDLRQTTTLDLAQAAQVNLR